MRNVYCCCVEGRRFDPLFAWLRTTQHCSCNKWLPTCRCLESPIKGRLMWRGDSLQWGIYCCCVEGRRFDSVLGWLRATQHWDYNSCTVIDVSATDSSLSIFGKKVLHSSFNQHWKRITLSQCINWGRHMHKMRMAHIFLEKLMSVSVWLNCSHVLVEQKSESIFTIQYS